MILCGAFGSRGESLQHVPRAAPPLGHGAGFWGKSDATRYGRFLMSNKKVLQAQEAMRLQVSSILVSWSARSGLGRALVAP